MLAAEVKAESPLQHQIRGRSPPPASTVAPEGLPARIRRSPAPAEVARAGEDSMSPSLLACHHNHRYQRGENLGHRTDDTCHVSRLLLDLLGGYKDDRTGIGFGHI